MQPANINYEPAGSYSHLEEDHGPDPGLAHLNPQTPSTQPPPQGQKYRHPVALFFHLFFKVSAVVLYLLGFFFIDNFVVLFIVITMLVAFDFWTVKNVTGRILAGLRWWNEVAEDGTNKWIFESLEDRSQLDSGESMIFWVSLFVTPVLWTIFLLSTLLPPKLQYMVIVFVALALNVANVVGYTKCRKDAKKKVQDAAGSFVFSQMFNRATNAV